MRRIRDGVQAALKDTRIEGEQPFDEAENSNMYKKD
jgi:hypothetical protein